MIALAKAPLGTPYILQETSVEFVQSRRLGAMGLRPGAPVSVVAKTFGGGRIVDVAGCRIALDKGIAAKVFVA